MHFYQRIDRHNHLPPGREKELEQAIRKAVKGLMKQTKIRIDSSHFHVIGSLEDKNRRQLASSVREEISKIEGIRWHAHQYFIPVSSLSPRYVSRLLEDIHKEPLI